MGGVDRAHLRGFGAAVSTVRWSDAPHRLHHAQRRYRQILEHIGAGSEPQHIAPARGPPPWDDCVAPVGDGVHGGPDGDMAAQPAPDYEVDQRINW